MDDLITWLHGQLDEDERVALATQAEHCDVFDGTGIVVMHAATGTRSVTLTSTVATYLARWDPARVLAEIEVKRRILVTLQIMRTPVPTPPGYPAAARAMKIEVELAEEQAAELLLRLLALPYAGRPGWREEWRAEQR